MMFFWGRYTEEREVMSNIPTRTDEIVANLKKLLREASAFVPPDYLRDYDSPEGSRLLDRIEDALKR